MTDRPKCPNCGSENINREMCFECLVIYRAMAEKQREQVEVGKELAKIVEWLSADIHNVWSTADMIRVLEEARACRLLEEV